jgi:hypothetical protein
VDGAGFFGFDIIKNNGKPYRAFIADTLDEEEKI